MTFTEKHDLPKPDGCHENWPSWKNSFVPSVHNRTEITPYVKLTLLKNAALVIGEFEPIDGNYLLALCNAFHQTRIIVNENLGKLITLSQVTEARANLLAESLLNVAWWIICLKMHTWTKIEPVTATLYLHPRVEGLPPVPLSQPPNHRTAHASNCSQSHRLHTCPEFSNLKIKDKWDLVKNRNLCHNCLYALPLLWSSSNRCKKCGKDHHTLLHSDKKFKGPKNWIFSVQKGF